MGSSRPQPAALAMAGGRIINAADVIALLREVYADGILTRGEAEELIAFDLLLAESTPDWCEFFAETIADHVVRRQEPAGAVDEPTAAWLIDAFTPRRQAATPAGLAAVVCIIETAEEVHPALSAFAIEQVRVSVIAGDRAVVAGRAHPGRMVGADDAALLARILIAAGGVAGTPVSREEAEALFDLHDAVAGANNHPAFDNLFFKAIAHHLIAAAGSPVVPRGTMLASNQPSAEDGGASASQSGECTAEPRFHMPSASIPSTSVGAEEIAWLAAHIMRDGRPTASEFALLRLFAGSAGDVDPLFRAFLDRAA